jgi:hypothetical protein
MTSDAAWRITIILFSTGLATYASAQPVTNSLPALAPEHQPAPEEDQQPAALTAQLNLDFTNAYFYRGIRQQDKGLIVQPAARVSLELAQHDDLSLSAFAGVWNSFGPNSGTTARQSLQDWYESDLIAGLTLTRGAVTVTASYTFLTSPSDAFETVEELGLTLSLNDSEWLKEWALNPYATLALETGANASDGADSDPGLYLELGVSPGFTCNVGATPVTITFPASVGISLADYYQDAAGNDDTFGFAQLGVRASLPLHSSPGAGTWTLTAGISQLFLGDNTRAFNQGDDTQTIAVIGLQASF